MRDLLASLDGSYLINCLHFRREASMNTQDLAFNESGDTQVVEHLCAVLPRVGVSILSDDFIIESIDRGHLSAFMVSSKKSNSSWVSYFVRHEKFESFDRIVASVDEISHEDVRGLRDVSSLVEQLEKVVELSMDVSANCDRG